MIKFFAFSSKIILLFFICCNALKERAFANDFDRDLFNYGNSFVRETVYYLDHKKFAAEEGMVFSNDDPFNAIELVKAKDSKIEFGSLIFKGDKKFTVNVSNHNTLSLEVGNGIINKGSEVVKVHLDQGSTLNLFGKSVEGHDLKTGSLSPVHFQVDNESHLNFEGASADKNTEVTLSCGSTLIFSTGNISNSLHALNTDSSSKIQLNESILILGNSDADNSLNATLIGGKSSQLIKEGSGKISLNGICGAFEGTITVNHGEIDFQDNVKADHAAVCLFSGTKLSLFENNSLRSLKTDEHAGVYLNDYSLTLGSLKEDKGEHVLKGKIVGNKDSQLIKEGLGKVSLNGDCSEFKGTILVNNGEIDFQDNFKADHAALRLLKGTKLSLFQNNSIRSLHADADSSIYLHQHALTIGSSEEDPVLVGKIIGEKNSQLIKEGAGKLSLNGDCSQFHGNMTINQGQLVLNCCHIGGNIIVNQGCGVSGSGLIANDLNTKGGVIDLNANDQLEISGNFSLKEKSQYLVKVNKHGLSSKIGVKGNATLENSSLKVSWNEDDFRLCYPYVILEAEKIEEGFSQKPEYNQSLSANIALIFDPESAKSQKKIALRFVPNLWREDFSSNQQNVAEELKKINNPNGDHDEPIKYLVALPEKEIANALDQFSGEQYAHFILACDLATQQFIRRIYTPLQAISIDQDCEELRMNKWITWADFEFGKGFQKGAHGYDMTEYNFTATIQRSMNDWLTEDCSLSEVISCDWLTGWTAGFAGSYAYQRYNFHHGDQANFHNMKGAFYTLLTKPVYYLLMDFIVGGTTGKMERSIKYGQMKEKADSDLLLYQANFYGELGLNNIFCYNLGIQPFIGIETGYYHLGNCKEHAAKLFCLNINEQSDCLATSYVGFRLFNFQNDDTKWNVSADIIWKHLFEYESRLKGKFAHFGDKFTISGPSHRSNGIEGSLSYFQRINECWLINAEVSLEKWTDYSNFYLSLGCSYKW